MAGKFYPGAKGSRAMPKQTLAVEVECETPLEPVAKYHKGKAGQHVLDSDGYVAEIYIIVTPKQEPEVSEPKKYTIPVEVPKAIHEKYSGGHMICWDSYSQQRISVTLTPRFQYPPELRSPGIWGIAIDENGAIGVYREKPGQGDLGWRPTTSWWTEDEVRIFHPSIKLPTLADVGGDWTKAIWQNPDFGKGE